MHRFTSFALAAALCAAACGDDSGTNNGSNTSANNSTSQNATTNNATTNNVDENIYEGADFGVAQISASEGGIVELASGRGTLEIPAGALSEDTEVRIRLNNSAPNNHDEIWNAGGGPVPFTINLEPKSTALSTAATLTFTVTEDELTLSNTDGQVWQFGLATDAGGEDVLHPAEATFADGELTIVTSVDELADYSPVGVGKVLLQPSCTDCPTATDHTLTVDVENVLAPTIGFDLTVLPGAGLNFATTESTDGAAAPMTHELVDFTFQCATAGETSVEVDFEGNLGADSPTFGWSAPISTSITCQ